MGGYGQGLAKGFCSRGKLRAAFSKRRRAGKRLLRQAVAVGKSFRGLVMNFDAKELVAGLQKHPFFKGLTEAQYDVLADCAMRTTFKPGDTIFNEGEVANRFYLIEEGEVLLETEVTPHEHIGVQLLKNGDVLGWSWLFPPYYWHFSAYAQTPVSAIFFYGTRLRERCEQDPALGFELMKRVSEIVIRRLQVTRKELLAYKHNENISRNAQKTV